MKTFSEFLTEVSKRHIAIKKTQQHHPVDIESERGEFERYPN